jgi:PST family polysaccharide transporter
MRDRDEALRTDHLLSDLGRRSARGGVVAFSAQAGKVVLQLVTVAVLARLLPPAAFGLIAMVAALNTIFDLVKEFGLSAATIRKSDITQAEVSALFWINAGAGALIGAALMLLAPAVAAIYGQPALVGVMRCLALGFLFSGLSVQHWALLRRQMRFGTIASIEVGSEAIGFVVAMWLATRHAGYWALVGQRITVPAVALVASWALCPWRPGPPRRVAGLGGLLGFGASVTGVNVAAALTRSLDQVLVGVLWGAGALGLYERAAKLLLAPSAALVAPLYSISMPLLSRLEGEYARYRHAFCAIVEVLAFVAMPGAALVAVCADGVVVVMFGSGWSAAAPLVACFAIAAAYQPVAQLLGILYLTQNRGREMLRAALVDAALCAAAIGAGLHFGPFAVAASLAAVGWGLRLPVAVYLATRRGPVQAADMLAAIAPAATAAAAVACAVAMMRGMVLPSGLNPELTLAIAAVTAAITAVSTLSALPHSRRTLLGLARRVPWLKRYGKAAPLAQS